jgi:serine/threonine protein kinase
MLAPGTLVHDRYTIQEALGAGSNAITYRALDSTTNKPVRLAALQQH